MSYLLIFVLLAAATSVAGCGGGNHQADLRVVDEALIGVGAGGPSISTLVNAGVVVNEGHRSLRLSRVDLIRRGEPIALLGAIARPVSRSKIVLGDADWPLRGGLAKTARVIPDAEIRPNESVQIMVAIRTPLRGTGAVTSFRVHYSDGITDGSVVLRNQYWYCQDSTLNQCDDAAQRYAGDEGELRQP